MNAFLNRIGEALYGDHWQSLFGESLDINERTIRRWVSGEVLVPIGVWKELFFKLDAKRDELEFLIGKVKEKIDTGGA